MPSFSSRPPHAADDGKAKTLAASVVLVLLVALALAELPHARRTR